jgi:hypothetical protein
MTGESMKGRCGLFFGNSLKKSKRFRQQERGIASIMKGGFKMNQKRRHFSNKVVFFRGESIFKSRFSQAKTI